jgi:hypothetical protein
LTDLDSTPHAPNSVLHPDLRIDLSVKTTTSIAKMDQTFFIGTSSRTNFKRKHLPLRVNKAQIAKKLI